MKNNVLKFATVGLLAFVAVGLLAGCSHQCRPAASWKELPYTQVRAFETVHHVRVAEVLVPGNPDDKLFAKWQSDLSRTTRNPAYVVLVRRDGTRHDLPTVVHDPKSGAPVPVTAFRLIVGGKEIKALRL